MIPAAALRPGDLLALDDDVMKVRKVRYSDPQPGRLIVETDDGREIPLGAAEKVEVAL